MTIIDAANDNTLTFGKEIVGNCSKLTSFYVPRQAINFPSFAGNGALTDIKISEQNLLGRVCHRYSLRQNRNDTFIVPAYGRDRIRRTRKRC